MTANCIAPRARTRLITQSFGEGMMAPPEEEGAFDLFAPENVAPLVTFLASDLAKDISGQVFVVHGGLVTLMQGWKALGEIDRGERWTVAELAERIGELFEGRQSALD